MPIDRVVNKPTTLFIGINTFAALPYGKKTGTKQQKCHQSFDVRNRTTTFAAVLQKYAHKAMETIMRNDNINRYIAAWWTSHKQHIYIQDPK